jgi:hypothetical protein
MRSGVHSVRECPSESGGARRGLLSRLLSNPAGRAASLPIEDSAVASLWRASPALMSTPAAAGPLPTPSWPAGVLTVNSSRRRGFDLRGLAAARDG